MKNILFLLLVISSIGYLTLQNIRLKKELSASAEDIQEQTKNIQEQNRNDEEREKVLKNRHIEDLKKYIDDQKGENQKAQEKIAQLEMAIEKYRAYSSNLFARYTHLLASNRELTEMLNRGSALNESDAELQTSRNDDIILQTRGFRKRKGESSKINYYDRTIDDGRVYKRKK